MVLASNRKENCLNVSDQELTDKHRSITVPLCKTVTPAFQKAWEILRGSWNWTSTERTLARTATGMEWSPCKKLCHRLRPFGLEKQWLKLSSAQQSFVNDIGNVGYNKDLVWKGYWIKENQMIKKCISGSKQKTSLEKKFLGNFNIYILREDGC